MELRTSKLEAMPAVDVDQVINATELEAIDTEDVIRYVKSSLFQQCYSCEAGLLYQR